jgi:hypothetical protein
VYYVLGIFGEAFVLASDTASRTVVELWSLLNGT